MELRRAADALLRSNASPLNTFLAPSNLVRQPLRWQVLCKQNANSLGRGFATSSRNHAPRTALPTTSSPQSGSPQSDLFPTSPSPNPKSNNIAQGLWGTRPSRQAPVTPEGRSNSASAMFQNLNRRNPVTMDISRMSDPAQISTQTPEERELSAAMEKDIFNSFDNMLAPSAPKPPPMRLNPSTGRTFAVGGNVDVARAFVLLNQSCQQNKVRADAHTQRFHERGGLKRKRLRRQRWRMRFGEGFKATVLRVKQLRNQGW